MFDIKAKPINDFLDAVDSVLNSNTFLLKFSIPTADNLNNALSEFIQSSDFKTQFFYNDSEREWHNYHDSKFNTELKKREYWPKIGKLAIDDFKLEHSTPIVDKREYLIAMLTANSSIGHFFSPYGTKKERAEAETIVDGFIDKLTGGKNWNLQIIGPNFLYNGYQHRNIDNIIHYFVDGAGCASDTATIIISEEKAYLLLTNGCD